MPIYNAALTKINAEEARRYAGLQKAENFSQVMIEEACEDALLLAAPKGIWTVYDYDCLEGTVKGDFSCRLEGESIKKHLAGCEKVIFLAATVGDGIESMVTRRFQNDEYTASLLLDAAATAAIEQVGDGIEKLLRPKAAAKGYAMRWRFSPGYGDWPIEQQPEVARLSHAEEIGVRLSSAMMLVPRKSITAVIGLYREDGKKEAAEHGKGCKACTRLDCPSRNI